MSRPARIDAVELLARLIAARSYSQHEGPAAEVLEAALREAGLSPRRLGDNVICERGSGRAGLLFNSHLDTVPAAPSWSRDPWTPAIEGERMYGLGATDAKSCVAAMAAAFVAAPEPGARGRLVLAATANEEAGGASGPSGLEQVLPELGPLAGAVVGEPTRLQICHGQRGLVRAVLRARGRAGHASRPWEGVNAIERAAEDVLALRALAEHIAVAGADPLLGRPTVQATVIQGGSAPNVIPERCEVVLDVRTTRTWDNDAALAALARTCASELEVRSRRFVPVATDPQAAIVRAARQALPQAQVMAFGGVSDLYFLHAAPGGPVPGVLIGPGDGRQSHQPDEFVRLPMVEQAVEAYIRLAEAFWPLVAQERG
ncbi:MAG: peptidase M20 [Planctomycetota bacterium]|nr:MAG: peptidase M20 [Planctomycetota bacterium]